MTGGSNRLIGITELAERLGIPLATVKTHWKGYGIPGYHIGKYVKFRERDVESWLEKQRVP